jgi:glycosyltransferase involved in cell wall biosynthesis
MRLLILPTWFPHRCYPLEGEYVLDQAFAIGAMRASWQVGLSLWNQGEGHISLRHLRRSPACTARALTRRVETLDLGDNVVSFTKPTLSWSHRWAFGNREAILAANRTNLAEARRRFGGIDLMHAHVSYPAGWVAMRLSEETGIPYVLTEHMGPFPLPVYARADGRLEPFIREPLERAAVRIAVSPALADQMAAYGIIGLDVVPNVVDERVYALVDAHRGGAFVFFTLCGMELGKGVEDLLQGIARLLPTLSETDRGRVRFRLGGDGPYLNRFKAKARELSLEPWVTWLGLMSREESIREYQGCDAFVLTSHRESFGIVFAEATACGKPVLATRCGGPESIVTPRNGILVGVGDIAGIGAAMKSMMVGERAFDSMAIRREFLERYSRAAVVDRLESLYRPILERSTHLPAAR